MKSSAKKLAKRFGKIVHMISICPSKIAPNYPGKWANGRAWDNAHLINQFIYIYVYVYMYVCIPNCLTI